MPERVRNSALLLVSQRASAERLRCAEVDVSAVTFPSLGRQLRAFLRGFAWYGSWLLYPSWQPFLRPSVAPRLTLPRAVWSERIRSRLRRQPSTGAGPGQRGRTGWPVPTVMVVGRKRHRKGARWRADSR